MCLRRHFESRLFFRLFGSHRANTRFTLLRSMLNQKLSPHLGRGENNCLNTIVKEKNGECFY